MPASIRASGIDDTYPRLRDAILHGQYMPNERLVETELARTLDSGRAAIRTALARLEQDGIVTREPFRGARVRAISESEAVEILEARAVLEGLSVRYAARNATDQDIAALCVILNTMRERFTEGDLLGVSEGNSHLHQRLLYISRHQTAARLIDGLQAQNVRYQFRTILVPGRAPRSLEEHGWIVDAVAAHDADAAETAMRLHLAHVADALRQTRSTSSDRMATLT